MRTMTPPDVDQTVRAAGERIPARARWAVWIAASWSVLYLVLGAVWLCGGPGYPWEASSVTTLGSSGGLSLMVQLGPTVSSATLMAMGLLGLLLVIAPRFIRSRTGWWLIAAGSAVLGVALTVVIPDFRLLAGLGYAPMLIIGWLIGNSGGVSLSDVYPWSWWNLVLLSVGGLGFGACAVRFARLARRRCVGCGRGEGGASHLRDRVARAAVIISVLIPTGYAITRFAWSLGIPLGVRQEMLDSMGSHIYFGAGLGAFAIVGAVLTVGLVRPWGEVFPRWIPVIGRRRVPVLFAVIPASIVSIAITSAGVMFVRLLLSSDVDGHFPAGMADVAGWLPETFWPLWGVALAVATWAYQARRRGECVSCGA